MWDYWKIDAIHAGMAVLLLLFLWWFFRDIDKVRVVRGTRVRARLRVPQHCWHATEAVYHNMPMAPQVCCYCGAKREPGYVRKHGHGPHLPEDERMVEAYVGGETPCLREGDAITTEEYNEWSHKMTRATQGKE